MNRKVVVTGSTGMLGSHLVVELIKRGYRDILLPVRSMNRLHNLARTLRKAGLSCMASQMDSGAERIMGSPLHVVELSLNDPIALREFFEGVDTVFHCAAMVSLDGANPSQIIECNVDITSHVVNAAIENRVRRLVHTSSIASLGELSDSLTSYPRGTKMIDETTNLESLAGTSPYGISKFISENRAWKGAAYGLEVVVVNPGIILGEGDWNSGGSTLIIPFAASGTMFYTTGVIGYVDVRDVARAMVELSFNTKAVGERFVLVSENMTYRDFITRVALLAGKRPPWINAGKGLLEIARIADTVTSKIKGREPQLTKTAVRSALKKNYYDGSKIKKFIPSFEYTPVQHTLQRIVKAYKDEI